MLIKYKILESLTDVLTNVEKKWYDVFNIKLRKILQKEIEDVFLKYFMVNHNLIDNSKTKIDVSLPLVGYFYYVNIQLFDRQKKSIIDKYHPSNTMMDDLVIQIGRVQKKWEAYYHTLFLKKEYQNKGIASAIIKSLDYCVKKLVDKKEVYYQATDVGRYMVSRIKNVRFKEKRGKYSEDHVDKQYKKWCELNNIVYKKLNKPNEYPKEYLLSNIAPEFIDYIVPI